MTVLALTEALPEDVYGMSDSGDDARGFRVFLRQRDKLFFDGDQLGFEPQDLARLLADVGRSARRGRHAAGRVDPGNEQPGPRRLHAGQGPNRGHPGAVRQSAQALPGAHGPRAGTWHPFPHSNNPDDPFGYTVDGAYISLGATTDEVDESAAFLNWFFNDDEVAVIYNGEHGPPGNVDNAAMVRETIRTGRPASG